MDPLSRAGVSDPLAGVAAKKRGRPPTKGTVLPDVDAPESAGVPVGYSVVERYRAEVAAHETLDDARKNYALDLLDRLLADLRG